MRAHEFIFEDYKTAKLAFVNSGADPSDVDQTINQFKQLSQKNQLAPNEKNIDLWPKQGFDKFKSFVQSKVTTPTLTQVKRKRLPGRSHNLFENDNWLIVIPLDKDASCFHGKNTDWCTTKVNQSYFEQYFYDREVTLIYCLNKQTGGLWAIAAHKEIDKVECFDQKDKSLTVFAFKSQTGLDALKLRDMALTDLPNKEVTDSRIQYKQALDKIDSYLSSGTTEPNQEIEKLILLTNNIDVCTKYIQQIPTSNKKVQMAAVTQNVDSLQFIKNPDHEVQMAAVSQYGRAIWYIENPDREVQIAAVSQDGYAIYYIDNPDHELQMAAVTQTGYAIRFIKNPDHELQMAAVSQDVDSLQFIKNPDLEVQMAAVTQNGYAIRYINNPDHEVQMAAVTQTGYAIRYINNPDHKLQMAAVSQNADAIKYIKNPDRDVIALAKRNQS
jgi:hypothetical protein